MNAYESLPGPLVLNQTDCPSLGNHAVARCVAAWDTVYQARMAKSKCVAIAERDAGKAFRQAMPPLCGHDNITDFIACAGYGMLIGAIKEENGNKFLYAAHVALGAIAKSKAKL